MNVVLPTFATRGGIPELRPLDPDLTKRLLQAANKNELHEDERAAIRAVCERVDEPSEFLTEMIERWQFKGAGERFMTRLFTWLAGERDVLWLGDMLRRQKPWTDNVWSRIAPRRRALDLLAAVDTPLGWLEVRRFQESTQIDDLYCAARDLLTERTTTDRLQSGEEDDVCAPALGFVDGVRLFEETRGLKIMARDRDDLHLVDDDGRKFAHVPRARNSEDAAEHAGAVAQSREHWHLLRPAILEVLDRGAHRLERAMTTQRTLGHDVWRRDWFEHPLLCRLAQAVIWRGTTDVGVFDFTLTDEREASLLDGTELSLDGIWGFEVAHPTSLDPEWQGVLADHEVVQPFEQVHRQVRSVDGKLDPQRLIAAERWGWQRRSRVVGPQLDMLVLTTRRHIARVVLAPGLSTTKIGRVKGQQKLQSIVLVQVEDRATRKRMAAPEWPPLLQFEIDLLKTRAAV